MELQIVNLESLNGRIEGKKLIFELDNPTFNKYIIVCSAFLAILSFFMGIVLLMLSFACMSEDKTLLVAPLPLLLSIACFYFISFANNIDKNQDKEIRYYLVFDFDSNNFYKQTKVHGFTILKYLKRKISDIIEFGIETKFINTSHERYESNEDPEILAQEYIGVPGNNPYIFYYIFAKLKTGSVVEIVSPVSGITNYSKLQKILGYLSKTFKVEAKDLVLDKVSQDTTNADKLSPSDMDDLMNNETRMFYNEGEDEVDDENDNNTNNTEHNSNIIEDKKLPKPLQIEKTAFDTERLNEKKKVSAICNKLEFIGAICFLIPFFRHFTEGRKWVNVQPYESILLTVSFILFIGTSIYKYFKMEVINTTYRKKP